MPFSTTFTASNTSAALKSMWPGMTPPLQSTTPVISWGWHHRKFKGRFGVFFGYPQKGIKRGWYPWNNETLTHPLLPFVHQCSSIHSAQDSNSFGLSVFSPLHSPNHLSTCMAWRLHHMGRWHSTWHKILGRAPSNPRAWDVGRWEQQWAHLQVRLGYIFAWRCSWILWGGRSTVTYVVTIQINVRFLQLGGNWMKLEHGWSRLSRSFEASLCQPSGVKDIG